MSGVWIFDQNGVTRLVRNPTRESFELKESPNPGTATAPGARPRVLVYLPANHVIRSYSELEQRLNELGWTRYHNPDNRSDHLLQFHRSDNTAHLISLPKNFSNFKSFHMYDIVVKNRTYFEVREPSAMECVRLRATATENLNHVLVDNVTARTFKTNDVRRLQFDTAHTN